MKKVLLFGVFDLFHFGHLRLIKRAAKLGDYCIVAVKNDEYVLRNKPPGAVSAFYSTEERMEMIRALRYVDEVVSYNMVEEDIQKIDFNILVKGPDQGRSWLTFVTKWCQENDKEIVTLPRTEGISSTYIKKLITDFAGKETE